MGVVLYITFKSAFVSLLYYSNSQRPLDAKSLAIFNLVVRISEATPMHPIYGLVLCEGGVLQYRGRSSKTPIFSGGLSYSVNELGTKWILMTCTNGSPWGYSNGSTASKRCHSDVHPVVKCLVSII
jgi:hypothetical protein